MNKQPRKREGEEINEGLVEGRNAVLEVLRSGRSVDKLLVQDDGGDGSLGRILKLAAERKIPVIKTDKNKLNSMSQTGAHQGVIAQCAAKDYVELSDILAIAGQRGEAPFVVLCDGIEDPHNLGAIIRTAAAAGVHGVVIPKRRNVGLTASVYKASAGAAEHMAVCKVTNLGAAMEELKTQGLWLYGADMDGQSEHFRTDLKGPIGLVIGGEDQGLSRLVKEKCDGVVRIPMTGGVPSLNASVAAALLMYEVVRQRKV